MSTTAKLFVDKNGISDFTSKDGATFSKAVEVNNESIDLTTGFIREEKLLFWVKGTNVDTVTKSVNTLVANINKGILGAYRAFSVTPFWSGDTMDINPSTNQPLNRYSQVRLCPAKDVEALHRQFVTVAEVAIEEVTA